MAACSSDSSHTPDEVQPDSGVQVNNSILKASLSADARYIVANLISSDGPLVEGETVNYIGVTVLIDTNTGGNQLINRRTYNRFVCRGCSGNPFRGPEISGSGRYMFFRQPLAETTNKDVGKTGIYRYDMESGEIILVTGEVYNYGFGTSTEAGSDLVVSDDGEREALLTELDNVHLCYVDFATSVSLQEAFRFCSTADDSCLFDSFRFVTNELLEMSGDGTGLTIVLPQADMPCVGLAPGRSEVAEDIRDFKLTQWNRSAVDL